MDNFVFHNPTKVIFGRNVLEQSGRETALFGRRVLLVSGRNSAKASGIYDTVLQSLTEHCERVVEFGGIQANPVTAKVREGAALARENNTDVICALGGGSVMDSAKAIAAAVPAAHDVWKFFTGKKPVKSCLPVITVPTLAASGSEVNSGMVLTNSETGQKFGFGNRHLNPKVAIMDPEATFTVPHNQTVYGCVDALSHLMELYFTNSIENPSFQNNFITGVARTIFENCEPALKSPTSYSHRANLMWSASLALNGLSAAGLGKVGFPMHLIEHPLSARYNLAHGEGLAIVSIGWLRYSRNEIKDRIVDFFQSAAPQLVNAKPDAESTIDNFEMWLSSLGAPTRLEDAGIHKEDFDLLAESSAAQAKIWRMREYDKEKVKDVLTACLKQT